MIYDISPTETPFMSMIAGRGKAKATYHEWQTDSLTAAAINSVVEGNDAAFATATSTTRVGNRTQIATKTILVSGTQDAVDKAGRDSEYRYQMAKRMAEIKRDMEFGLTGNYASSAGSTSTPRRLGRWKPGSQVTSSAPLVRNPVASRPVMWLLPRIPRRVAFVPSRKPS